MRNGIARKILGSLILLAVMTAGGAYADEPTKPAVAHKPATAGASADWAGLLGAADDGWTPALIRDLAGGMTPAEAGKVLPGAEKASKYGIAKVKVKDKKGVQAIELSYLEDRENNNARVLRFAQIVIAPSVNRDKEEYQKLVDALIHKYGPVKQPEDIEKKQITWMNKNFKSAQLYEIGGQLTLKIALE